MLCIHMFQDQGVFLLYQVRLCLAPYPSTDQDQRINHPTSTMQDSQRDAQNISSCPWSLVSDWRSFQCYRGWVGGWAKEF